jgi:hypothetical protein
LGSAAWNDVRISDSDVFEQHLALDGQTAHTEEVVWVRAVGPSAVDANRIAARGRPQSWGSLNGAALWPMPAPQESVPMRLGDVLVIGEWELSLEGDGTGEVESVERDFLAAIEHVPSMDDNRHTSF